MAGYTPHWNSNLPCTSWWIIVKLVISLKFEAMKANLYIKPSGINMLPDVGMGWKRAKYVSWNRRMLTGLVQCHGIHLIVPWLFPPVGFPCSYQWHQRHRPPSPHLYLFLWETFLLPLFLYLLLNASCMTWTRAMYMQACTKRIEPRTHVQIQDFLWHPMCYSEPCISLAAD